MEKTTKGDRGDKNGKTAICLGRYDKHCTSGNASIRAIRTKVKNHKEDAWSTDCMQPTEDCFLMLVKAVKIMSSWLPHHPSSPRATSRFWQVVHPDRCGCGRTGRFSALLGHPRSAPPNGTSVSSSRCSSRSRASRPRRRTGSARP